MEMSGQNVGIAPGTSIEMAVPEAVKMANKVAERLAAAQRMPCEDDLYRAACLFVATFFKMAPIFVIEYAAPLDLLGPSRTQWFPDGGRPDLGDAPKTKRKRG